MVLFTAHCSHRFNKQQSIVFSNMNTVLHTLIHRYNRPYAHRVSSSAQHNSLRHHTHPTNFKNLYFFNLWVESHSDIYLPSLWLCWINQVSLPHLPNRIVEPRGEPTTGRTSKRITKRTSKRTSKRTTGREVSYHGVARLGWIIDTRAICQLCQSGLAGWLEAAV